MSINDSATNLNSTPSRTFYLDGVNPSPSASCEDIYRGDDLNCVCSATDNLKLNSTSTSTDSSYGLNSQHTTGTFTYTCSAVDKAGNSKSSTASFTVMSSGGSISSSSSNEWSEEKIHTVVKDSSSSVFVFDGFGSELSVFGLEIKVKNEIKKLKVIVRKYDSLPSEVSIPKKGDVQQFFQIDPEDLGNNLDEAKISVRVPKAWIQSKGFSKEGISIFRFDEGNEKWEELETNYIKEDNLYYYYDSFVSGFSYFAISEKSTENQGVSENVAKSGNSADSENKSNSGLIWLIVGAIVLGAIIFYSKKK